MTSSLKIVSWNINGLNNILSKTKDGEKKSSHINNNSLATLIIQENPDIVCLQEVRCQTPKDLLFKHFGELYPYIYTNNPTHKKGYSGTAVLSKVEPCNVIYNMEGVVDDKDVNDEGRIIRVEYPDMVIINVYTPNSKPDLSRLEYRQKKWDSSFRMVVDHHSHVNNLIICGDLNVAHTNNDIHNPRHNANCSGFTEQEKLSFSLILHNFRLSDAFRVCHPNTTRYSWWSNMGNARIANNGWRIDYFLINGRVAQRLVDSDILINYHGSDHAPTFLQL
jgi:exodeoxyribonuclease-3